MTALGALVDATLADPLAAARAHAAAGGRVIGYYTCNVPVELILAADAFALHLPHLADGATPRADRYMEPLFDRALRSAFERWLAGDFAFVETVVLPRSQDSSQRVYYYVAELIRTGELHGPAPLLFDLLKVPRTASEEYTVASASRLAASLGVRRERLPAAIERMNARRRLLERFAACAAGGAAPSDGFADRVLRAALYAPQDEFDRALAEWLDSISGRSGLAAGAGARIALVGSVPPDERLHRAIGSAGGTVVAEHHLFGPARHGPCIGPGEQPLEDIARHYHSRVASVRDFGAPLETAIAQASNLQGVVLWLTEEDDALAWQVPAVVRATRSAGLPLLQLTRQDWLASAQTLESIRAFVATVPDEAAR